MPTCHRLELWAKRVSTEFEESDGVAAPPLSVAPMTRVSLVTRGIVVCSLMCLAAGARAEDAKRPLSASGITNSWAPVSAGSRVAALVAQHGISFELTPEIKEQLRAAGAGDQVLGAVDRASLQAERTKLEAERKRMEEERKLGAAAEEEKKRKKGAAEAAAKKKAEAEAKKTAERERAAGEEDEEAAPSKTLSISAPDTLQDR